MHRPVIAVAGAAAATCVAGAVAHGRVDGSRVPLRGCRAPSVVDALPSLEAAGVAVVDGVVDAALLAAVRETEVYRSMPVARPPRKAGRQAVGARRGARPDWTPSAAGRMHRREETFGADDLAAFEAVERRVRPLADAFFACDGAGGASPVYRSELQLLTALPRSASQAWHRDNQSRGLSVLVPLVDFTPANGPTQLLPGSHADRWGRVAADGARVVVARTGAVIAYDSRTYHRGLGNPSADGRPAIVLCYDRAESPPPGCGPYGSLAHTVRACALNVGAAAWRALAGGDDA